MKGRPPANPNVAMRKARAARGWTQREVARRAGVHPAMVGLLECQQVGHLAKNYPTDLAHNTRRIAAVLGLPWEDVVGEAWDVVVGIPSELPPDPPPTACPAELRAHARRAQERMAYPDPAQLCDALALQEVLHAALTDPAAPWSLAAKPRQSEVIQARFGFPDLGSSRAAGWGCLTLAEVGRVFNISKDRVRQIEQAALRRLQANPALRPWEP